jgi:hypothetical protein
MKKTEEDQQKIEKTDRKLELKIDNYLTTSMNED